jgi:multiple sugar transport system ATP-binding protein
MSHGLVQQVGTSPEIYDRPANTFVAGFIGSPAMNLVPGKMVDGVFTAPGLSLPGLPQATATLGFRAEDLRIGEGQIRSQVYAIELLGEALVSVRAPREFRTVIGAPISILLPPEALHCFEAKGARL